MERLHIPFSRHTQTTRRQRWVVWVLGAILLICLFLLSRVGVVWFSRNTIFSLAPEETVLAVQVQLTKKTQPIWQEFLHSVPLISKRSLDIKDLIPFTHGELAVFITQQGDRAVAIRTTKNELPQTLLEKYHISVQEKGDFILLSEKLLPITGVLTSSRRSFFPLLQNLWLGKVMIPQEKQEGMIYYNASSTVIQFKTKKQISTEQKSVKNADLYLNQLFLNENDVSSVKSMHRLFTFFLKEGDETKPLLLNDQEISVLFRQTQTSTDTLLIFKNHSFTTQDVTRNLQIIGALAKPSFAKVPLPDGTSYDKIIVSPDLIPVEQISLNEENLYRVAGGTHEFILALFKNNELLLSNSQTFIEDYLAQSSDEKKNLCETHDYLNPEVLLSQIQLESFNSLVSVYEKIFSKFSLISFETKKYSMNIQLCSN
ncbi:MAG: hypothetical protein UT30_C0009G0012 [Candidatus Uhrbacteria bacterium GW2011_GWF2_39_13]|uniref:Uncharacterized protein n=1 Tax=Candidatus Uhrbacteria bacterium GW2011_GWF2_39_13 TaxID=1618995 RepID=A0A0G0QRP8_9BACT|nr:MAG: hypothetical protein UT30_C0009G0012 [Candidatus Uhrbacteria bacterium GW2011_GWF2_39_13]HAU65759.1 hypothetical protein [Candidatus Uhrbacteria bacterium]